MATNKDKDKEQQSQQNAGTTDTKTYDTTPDPAEEAKKQAEAIIEAAKAEAAKIVESGKQEAQAAIDTAKAEIEAQAAATATAKPAPAEEEEKVPIHLFKDNGKYKDDVFVAVNGRRFQIKRGETVMVPRCVAEVLDQSMAQDQETANFIAKQSEEYAAEAARLGL